MKKLFYILAFLLLTLSFANAQWVQVANGLKTTAFSFAFNGNNIFAGTNDGVFLSTNNSISWIQTSLNNLGVSSLVTLGNNIFAGTSNGVFLSTNNGTNWTQTALNNKSVPSLAILGNNIFAGTLSTNPSGVYISTDNGTSWTQTALNNRWIFCLAVSGSTIYAGSPGSSVYFSTNNGASWTQTTLNNNNKDVVSLTTLGNNIFAGTYTYGVFLTTNNGTNWTQTALNYNDVYSLATLGNNIFAGTYQNGVFQSTNNGASWIQTAINSASFSLETLGNTIFAGTQYYGIYLSTDNGVKWTTAPSIINVLSTSGNSIYTGTLYDIFSSTDAGLNWSPKYINLKSVTSLVTYNNYIFAGTYYNGIYYTTNDGVNWLQTSLNNKSIRSLVRKNSRILAGISYGGVTYSTNEGISWIQSSLNDITVNDLYVLDSNIYAGTDYGGAFISSNNGVNWSQTNLNSVNINTFTSLNNILYAGTNNQGVYYTINNGANWIQTKLNDKSVNSLTTYGSLLFASTWGSGVYYSNNLGNNWIQYGLDSQNVTSIISSGGYLVAGTDGNGLYRRFLPPTTPELISPANYTVGLLLTQYFIWTKPTYTAGYQLQISSDSLFNNIFLSDSTLTDSLKNVSNLSPLTNYWWRVRAKNSAGYSSYSDAWKFRTLGLPFPVTLVSPSNNAIDQPVTINFKWQKTTDQTLLKGSEKLSISYYWFELSMDSLFNTIVIKDSTLTDSIKTVSGLVNAKQYWWRVKAKNEIGWSAFSSVWKFTTIVPVPQIPVHFSPVNNSLGNEINLNLIWNKSAYSVNYHVQFSSDSLFSNLIINDSLITDSTKSIAGLTPLTNYWWRVKAKNIAGASNFSAPWKFKTIGAPFLITLSTPENNSVNQPVNITFHWLKAIDQTFKLTVSNYLFQLSSDSLFTNIIFTDSTLSDTAKSITGLSNITNYWWRVKANNQIGWGDFSSIWKFTTIVPLPVSPTLITPINNSSGNPLNLSLIWSKPQYATGYNVVLATDAGFANVVINDSLLTDSVKALTNLIPLTNYYWKVRTKNIAGWSVFSSAYTFKTVGVPTQVILSTPANNATGQPVNLTFKWFKAVDQVFTLLTGNRISNKGENTDDPNTVSNYWFELATDSMFTAVVTKDSTLTDTTKSVTSLLNYTNYFWRVKAKNQIGWAAFSSIWKFTTIVSIPVAPVLLLPANNSTGVSLTPLLDWNDVQYSASYRIQVSADSLFSTTLWDTSGVVSSQLNIPANKLTGLTKYYWRVNATNAGGTGTYSTVWNFRTLQNLTLNLKVYLEGFWDGSTQVSDTIMVYLANSATPYAFIDSNKVILSTSGTSVVNFTKAPNANYYIVINHRNHLETWSKLPQSFVTNITVNYDFTTAANKAFGDNMKQVGSVWVFYGGDANRDGSIDALDVSIFITQFGNSGYLNCDLNGDGSVDALDVPIIVSNFGLGKAVPTLDVQLPGNIRKEKVIEELQKRYKLNGESEKKETIKKEKTK